MFLKKKKILIVILVMIILIGISILMFYVGKSVTTESKKRDQMNGIIAELVDKSYLYFVLSEGIIPTKEEIVEVDGVTYKKVNLDKIKNTEDISNLVDSLFVEFFRTDRLAKIYDDRKFVELDNELYVNYDESKACDKIDPNNLKDYTYEKTTDNRYMIFTLYGQNYAIYENDNWYLNVELLQCTDISNEHDD